MTVSFSPLKANGQLFTHLPDALLSDLVNRAAELGATQLGWG